MRTNSKSVRTEVRSHLLEFYEEEGIGGLIHDMEAVKYGGMGDVEALRHMVQGGSFLVYDNDIVDFLNELGINPEGKVYPIEKSRKLYEDLIVMEALKMVSEKSVEAPYRRSKYSLN